MNSTDNIDVNFKEELNRLARFGANVTDAHSCFIFLPLRFLALFPANKPLPPNTNGDLLLVGYHSLSREVSTSCIIRGHEGVISWIAKNGQPVHISPFEYDSRMLEVYTKPQDLKSFIGLPINIIRRADLMLTGVIACDSKKAFAFSKLQGKLLEDLAAQISSLSRLALMAVKSCGHKSEWADFLQRCAELEEALGINAIEVMRLSPVNLKDLEIKWGMSETIALFSQVVHLIEQSLPPPRTIFHLPDGDILIVIDNMMTSLYENKIEAICRRVCPPDKLLEFQIVKCSKKALGLRNCTLEDLLRQSASIQLDITTNGTINGKRNWA